MRRTKVLVVDDHELVRQGLRAVLELETDLAVVGEACDGMEAIKKAGTLSPDVVLLDLRMPGMSGVEACRAIKDNSPDTKVLVLTHFDDDDEVYGAIDAGASSYLLKHVSPPDLVRAIQAVNGGQTLLDPAIAERVLRRAPRSPDIPLAEEARLSTRELEVLRLMAEGHKNRDIAKTLWIEESTVKTHVSHILQKLGVTDRAQAVLRAYRCGLVRDTDGPSPN